MIRWFAKNHVSANVLMLAILLVGGYLAYFKLGVEVEPAQKFPEVEIRMKLPGASPEEVEKKIILPIEQALDNLSGVRSIESKAYTGSAHIEVNAKSGVDLDKLKADVESRMERITTLPQDREAPHIYIPDTAHWKEVISVAIYGDLTQDDLLKAARKVRDDLTAKPEISKVSIVGSRQREISIELSPEKLNAFRLSFTEVQNAIKRSSFDRSAGTLRTNGERISIRSNNKAYYGEEFERLIIANRNGSVIRLEDIATITDSFEQQDQKEVTFNGKPAIFVEVKRLGDENALAISNVVHDYINESENRFPTGVNLAAWDDDSVSLKGRITTLVSNLIQGVLLVMVMLGLFLRPKIAFWVTLGIPVSFAGAAIYMYFFDVTLNNMSLFGFIIVLGIVVDDAIVTGENVFTHIKSGRYSGLDAAVLGTKEVATSVTFGVVTTMVAFSSMFFLEGYLAEMAKQIPLVVIPVLFFSLIESKLILPAHLKNVKGEREKRDIITKTQSAIANSMEWFVKKLYRPLLNAALSYRFAVITAFAVIFWVGYQFKETRMDFHSMPSSERYYIYARLEMKQGTDMDDTRREVERIAAAAVEMREDFMDGDQPLIGNIVTSTAGWPSWGGFQPEKGFILLEILPPSLRSKPGPKNAEIAKLWTERVGEIEQARSFKIRTETHGGRNTRDENIGISIQLRGNNEEEKAIVATKMKQWFQQQKELSYAYGSAPRSRRELRVKMKPLAKENGKLTDQSLAEQVRTAFHGTQIEKLQRGEDEVRVMLRLPESVRTSLHTLSTLRINLNVSANQNANSTANKEFDKTASITQYADIVETNVPPNIDRVDRSRVIYTGANAKTKEEAIKLEPKIHDKMEELCQTHPSVSWKFTGTLANYREEEQRFLTLLIGVFLALFALLAIPFKSFLQPVYVLAAVPFGMVGAYAGHYFLDITPSILSRLGILALLGVVVNDSLVMVDYMNKRRAEGVPLLQAVQEAGARRFRPIVLTSITTFAGLMPIIFESSIQAQYLIPMAVSLGFGILFATLITLILIPCIYYIGESAKETLRNALGMSKKEEV